MGPATVTTEAGEVHVTGMLTSGLLDPGGSVLARLRVSNAGAEPVRYPGGGSPECSYRGEFSVLLSDVRLDPGRHDWSGSAALVKELALPAVPERVRLSAPGRPSGPHGCDATALPATLAPGEVVEVTGTWDGATSTGYPVPAGRYEIAAEFVIYRGALDDVERIRVDLPVTVIATEQPATPGRALDVALADPAVSTWLVAHPASTWHLGPSIAYRRASRDYELRLDTDDGDPLRVVIADDGHGPAVVAASG